MAAAVKEIDRGWKRIKRAMTAKPGLAAKVGVQGPEAEEDHDGLTNVKLFSIHEFGRGRAPERSVFRSTFDENRKKYERELKELGQDLITGKQTAEGGLLLLGEMYRGDMINKVRKGQVKPPLAPATVEARMAKGGAAAKARARKPGKSENIPLWDTGQMMGSISVVVEK